MRPGYTIRRMPHSLSRRGFLQATGAGAFASLGAPPASCPAPSAPQAIPPPARRALLTGWFDRPMRWVQLTLVENDPGRFDPQFWLDYFRRLHADAATLSAGGIVAYYPTADPAPPSQRVARSVGSVRHARLRLSRARHARRRAHGSARGAGRRAGGASGLDCRDEDRRAAAALGQPRSVGHVRARPLQLRVHGSRSTARSSTMYKVDGIFANRWAPQGGDCFCVHCVQNYKDATGAELPRTTDARDPLRRQYLEWRKARLTELWKQWDATVRAVNPEARFIPNGPPDLKTAGELAAIQFTDNQARRGLTPPWTNGRRAKEYRCRDGPEADRRDLQRRPRRTVSLEGFGAERAGDPALGGGGHGQRHAPLGHEVLRRPLRSPLAAGRRADLSVALRPRALPAQRSAAGARGGAALRADRDLSRRRRPGRSRRRPRARHVSRAHRSARAVRARARGVPDARIASISSGCSSSPMRPRSPTRSATRFAAT